MLIKLGASWFAADKVEKIGVSMPPYGLVLGADGRVTNPLPTGKDNHYVYVRTFNCSETTVAYVDSIEEAEAMAGELATKVNAALQPSRD